MTLCAALLCLVTAAGPSGVLTRPPELQHFVEAVYPPEDLAAHREAEVTMEVEIDEAGSITGLRKSSVSLAPPPTAPDPQAEERFARAALEAAARFHFSPAEIDGKPAPVQISYRYHFTIRQAATATDEGPVVIEGRLLERGTRRALAAASVSVEGGPSVEADAQGRFALRGVTSGHRRIRVVSPDHEPFETSEEVRAGEKTEVTYYVRRRATSRYETVVQGERDRKEVAKKSLSLEEIKRVPGTSGDAVAVVQMLPGVARAPYGLGLLPVRGTRPGDTVGHVDGITIPNIYHFGGLPISVMNADALSGLDFYPGNFSARFGRALGGAVDLRSRPGETENIHGYGDVSLLEARALVEAPTGENGSFLATARRSYVDLVLSAAGSDSLSPRYYDYLVRHDWKLKGGRAAIYGYGSSDALTINKKGDDTANPEEREGRANSIAFHRLQGLYEKAVSDRITARVVGALGYDGVDFAHASTISAHARFWSLQLRAEADWTVSRAFQLTAGLDGGAQRVSYSVLAPIAPADNRIADPILVRQTVRDSDAGYLGSPGAYLYSTWSPLPPLRLVPGVRADAQGGSHVATVGRVDPRLALFYDPAPWLTLKAAAGLYSQPPPIQRGELTRKFGNPDLRFQESRQYMVGATTRFGSSTTFDVQAYYKDLSSIIIPSDRIVERAGALQQENYSNGGSGFSRGVEVMLREELSSGLLGWISYTLSQSRQKPAEGLAVTDFLFDQRHNLYVMISQKLPRDWTIGASLRYTTGGWYTPVTLGVYDSDGDYYQRIEGRQYSRRQPYFLELDARVDKRWVYERWSLGVYLDVRNVTNRRNVEDAEYSYDYTQRVEVSGLPLFPNLGVRGEF